MGCAGIRPCLTQLDTVRVVLGQPTVPRWWPKHGTWLRVEPKQPMKSVGRVVLGRANSVVPWAGLTGMTHLASSSIGGVFC